MPRGLSRLVVQLSIARGLILRVLQNLLGNALRFTPPGGCVVLGIGRASTGLGLAFCKLETAHRPAPVAVSSRARTPPDHRPPPRKAW